MKRGEKLNDIKKKYFNKFSENSHKKFISSWYLVVFYFSVYINLLFMFLLISINVII
jgi:hypothetical protein